MPMEVDAVVVSNHRLSAEYNVIGLAAPDMARQCQPGQFVMVKHGFSCEPLLRRPFSVFEILHDARDAITGFSLLSKAVGVVTRTLLTLPPGERLRCLGPLGRPFDAIAPPQEAWMVAGGVGLAPFLTLAERLLAAGVSTTLFYGARTAAELYYLDEFAQLGVRTITTTEDGSAGDAGFVTIALDRELRVHVDPANLTIYACGPTPMMRAVVALTGQYGCASEVSLEPIMGCGLGGCYSCVVPVRTDSGDVHYARSCIEGPVFPGHQVVWDALA